MKTLCTRCGYRFQAKSLQDPCPYCGERKTLTELENADVLVEGL